jgi:hypothetical protein
MSALGRKRSLPKYIPTATIPSSVAPKSVLWLTAVVGYAHASGFDNDGINTECEVVNGYRDDERTFAGESDQEAAVQWRILEPHPF